MKMRTPSPASAAAEQLDQLALRLDIVEQQADALEILGGAHILEQIGLAADDQRLRPAAAAAGP